jgi:hypothetical protein
MSEMESVCQQRLARSLRKPRRKWAREVSLRLCFAVNYGNEQLENSPIAEIGNVP